jgi:hypothetical protein
VSYSDTSPDIDLWAAMIGDITKHLSGGKMARARAISVVLGQVLDGVPEPQRKHYAEYVRAQLPAWLVAGLSGCR